MSHPLYENTGSPETKVMEECAEVIQEICKAQRFGWFNHHPDDPKRVPNIERVMRELDDLHKAMGKLDSHLLMLHHKHFSVPSGQTDLQGK